MINLKARKIAVLDDKTPARRRVKWKPDGKNVVVERIPWGPYLKVVKPSGSVVRIPLATHRINTERQNQYRVYMEDRKPRIGAIPYGKCPQTLAADIQAEWLPESLRNLTPCRVGLSGKAINDDNCCACIEKLITHRKAAHVEAMAKIERKTNAQLQAEAAVGLTTAVKDMANVQTQMAEVVKGLADREPPHPPAKGTPAR